MQNKLLIPISIIAAGIIIALAFVSIDQKKELSGEELSADLAAEQTIKYINENLLAPGTAAFLINVSDEGSVYKIRLEIKEGEVVLGEFDSYISKDGEFLFPDGYNMKEGPTQDFEAEAPTQPETPSLPQEELQKFVECLAGANFLIYGNKDCPACASLAAQFGGYDIVDPIFIECTEKPDLCQEKEIRYVPTIFIGDQEYVGARSFEDFAQETGCNI